MLGLDDVFNVDLMDVPSKGPQLKAHKVLPHKREFTFEHNSIWIPSLGSQEENTAFAALHGSTYTPTPTLPLTPPGHSRDSEPTQSQENPPDERHTQSARESHDLNGNATPTHKLNPPTPDVTPPRVVSLLRKREALNQIQVSMSSTADSFTTAREALSSDDDAEKMGQVNASCLRPNRQKLPHPLRINTSTDRPDLKQDLNSDNATTPTTDGGKKSGEVDPHAFDCFDGQWVQSSEVSPATSSLTRKKRLQQYTPGHNKDSSGDSSTLAPDISPSKSVNRWNSLRDRVQTSEKDTVSPSVEKFGEEIGWNFVGDHRRSDVGADESWRDSVLSTTSTIEAMVIDSPPQKRHTLRHMQKVPSLRSVTSSMPASNRYNPGLALNDSQSHIRQLHRKSARISDQTRWSVSSDMSALSNVTSSAPRKEYEKIPVVVIPQRRSSLKSSTTTSRDHSRTRSLGSDPRPTTAPDANTRIGSFDASRPRRRTMSESYSRSNRSTETYRMDPNRGPSVPRRNSSLSAPTSRNNSRAPSITSNTSRYQRKKSDAQLSNTRDEPATPRHVREKRGKAPILDPAVQPPAESQQVSDNTADVDGPWNSPSLRHTPFQPSLQSLSPGPVEIHEARAVPFFSHNNTSLLLVEQCAQSESRVALRTLSVGTDSKATDPHTPLRSTENLAPEEVESPLRNPRQPPQPPQLPQPPAFNLIPPTPLEEERRRLGQGSTTSSSQDSSNGLARRFGSVKRALGHRRRPKTSSSSTVVATHRIRNRKTGQEIDSRLHPFWKPRGFWDGLVDPEEESRNINRDASKTNDDSNNLIGNSLGIPHKRAVFEGPFSIIRRVSKHSTNSGSHEDQPQDGLVFSKKYSSNQGQQQTHHQQQQQQQPNHRGHRRMHVFSSKTEELRENFSSLHDLQNWLAKTKNERQQQKLEARRDRLRKSIGEKKVLVNNSAAVTPQ